MKPVLVLSVALSVSCGGSTPTRKTEECRRYPLSFEENGLVFTCELDQGAEVTLNCASGALLRSWEYASLVDFVREPSIANRIRATRRTTTGGLLLVSYSQTVRSYEYDAEGRLTRRRRTSEESLGTFELDDTRYTSWDGSGRPVAGETRSGQEQERITLAYHDGERLVETSAGESTRQDVDGNLLSEIEIFGLGPEAFHREREYRTTATKRICVP